MVIPEDKPKEDIVPLYTLYSCRPFCHVPVLSWVIPAIAYSLYRGHLLFGACIANENMIIIALGIGGIAWDVPVLNPRVVA